jgi:glycosyltransferase involved in cell wall biosynthesis
MKVAILYELLGRSRGGIEAWIYHASQELVRQGHHVTVYNCQPETPGDAAPPGVEVRPLRQPRYVPGLFLYARAKGFRRQLKEVLPAYDAVWARSCSMAWAASKVLGRRKTVYVNAAPYALYGQMPFLQRLRSAVGLVGRFRAFWIQMSVLAAWMLERNAIRKCTNVFLSAARQKETLDFFCLTRGRCACCVIPPGVDITRFHPGDVRWTGCGQLRLLSVCRLVPGKNLECVLAALAMLRRSGLSVVLTVVGEGGQERELRTMALKMGIEAEVAFVGRQANVQEWYRKNHVFVLPSLYEGFGSVYVEAMASGLPCIAVSGAFGEYSVAADEIIDHETTGFLMRRNDPSELADYVRRLYANPGEWKAQSVAARSIVLTRYRWESVVTALLRLSGH